MITSANPEGLSGLTYDPRKLAFVADGMEIRNPFLSDCGRYAVDPREAYGFEVEEGRGWRRDQEEGGYLLLTNATGDAAPTLEAPGEAMISFVDTQGMCQAQCLIEEVPFEV